MGVMGRASALLALVMCSGARAMFEDQAGLFDWCVQLICIPVCSDRKTGGAV